MQDSQQAIQLSDAELKDVHEIKRLREDADTLFKLAAAKREITQLKEQLFHEHLRSRHGVDGHLTIDADRGVLIIDQPVEKVGNDNSQ